MNSQEILNYRLVNQGIVGSRFKKPEELVRWLGAVQAQDYLGGLWAVGLRTGETRVEIERAIAERKIIRTWPMRGTLHFLAATDARWMLDLLTPRINQAGGWATRRKFLGLTEKDIKKGGQLVAKALRGGKILTRPELYQVLELGGISVAKQRGAHILGKLAHELLVCLGPYRGKSSTVVLLDEWLPRGKVISREDSLKELVKRYFTSHGPATIQDLAWWSGLKVVDIKSGLELAGGTLRREEIGGKIYWMGQKLPLIKNLPSIVQLLPPFDEYLVAYKDRSMAGTNLLSPVIVVEGKVVGTWGRLTQKNKVRVRTKLFSKLTKSQSTDLVDSISKYVNFMR